MKITMSFVCYSGRVQEGDEVIIFLGHSSTYPLTVRRGQVFQTKYGALRHSDVIDKQYGSRVACAKGWAYVLHINPELWTNNLPHRTQILYQTDISMVTLMLDLKPGSIVCESGTGSGSLSHAIVRTIAPDGHLYTFDFHQQRVDKCREEFVEHKINELVTAECRDVCTQGFGPKLKHVADAVFLDLPLPWQAIPHAKNTIKLEGGRLCSFSPCMEQVQESVRCMLEEGFTEISTLECLLRTYDVRTISLPEPPLYPTRSNSTTHCQQLTREGVTGSDVTNNSQDDFTAKCAVAVRQIPGHTGYLTFATLLNRTTC